jgi:transposase
MITLSQKKLNQAHVLARLISDESFTIAEAAEEMGFSKRHVKRLKGEFKKYGADALVHKNIGRLPAHAIPEEVRQEIIELKMSKLFEMANFCHFREIIGREKFNIHISYSALHGILTSAGIKSPKKRRPAKTHFCELCIVLGYVGYKKGISRVNGCNSSKVKLDWETTLECFPKTFNSSFRLSAARFNQGNA